MTPRRRRRRRNFQDPKPNDRLHVMIAVSYDGQLMYEEDACVMDPPARTDALLYRPIRAPP